MGYLDELRAQFERNFEVGGDEEMDCFEPAFTGLSVFGNDAIGRARSQLHGTRCGFHEEPEGTFKACGNRYGCGYAEATVVVDPETGETSVDINSHLPIPPERHSDARRLFRMMNSTFILPGLVVGDDGCMHFSPEDRCNVNTDDIEEWVGKGFATIHGNAHLVAQLQAGRPAWEIYKHA